MNRQIIKELFLRFAQFYHANIVANLGLFLTT